MKPSKYLIFKVEQQHYVIKSQIVIDVVENPAAYQRGGKQKCGVRFNGKDVNVIELKGNSENLTRSFNSILIIEIYNGYSKDFIGLGLDEVIGIVSYEDLLLNSTIPYSEINPINPQSHVLFYEKKPLTFLSVEELLKNQMINSGLKHINSFIPN